MPARTAILGVALVVLSACNGGGASGGRSAGRVFDDDFATDKGWTGNVPNDIFVDTAAGVIRWHADRSKEQYLALPISPFSGDATIEVVGQIDGAANNCDINIGLSDGIAGALPNVEPPGVYVALGFFGGGCSYFFFFCDGRVIFDDGSSATIASGHVCNGSNGTFIEIPQATKVRATLRISGATMTLTVLDDATGAQLGRHSVALPRAVNPFTHVLVGKYGTTDWPTADGTIDRITVTRR